MKLKEGFLLLLSITVLSNCGGTEKTVARDAQSKALDQMVADKSFEIKSDWASPLSTNSLNQISNAGLLPPGSTVGRINLIGNSNYVRMEGDSISAYLPYYGERQVGGGYNNDGGAIQFKGIPDDLEIVKDERTQRRQIRFNINEKTETFNVGIVLFPNLTSTININSSQRFPIRYNGRVAPISKE